MIRLSADHWVADVHDITISDEGVLVNECYIVDSDYLAELCSACNISYPEVQGRLKRWQSASENQFFSKRSSRSLSSDSGG